ncbi:PASTA domain-containing protein [Aureispira anguillae]|uniref:PASTA domain-containing protein n=1 Tax=Aureispira anguillae TaxID=2864201 RepID=A0A915YHQ0_9BACT|nr:PASTA domain-containing protein [Aureispira anguillae]BDS13171.1 PASTA domain-containing protein [Aureispira anguillae]
MSKIRTFFSDLWYIRKTILLNLVGGIVLTLVLIKVLMWALSFYTLHGESIEVPDLVNMKLEEAEKLLATRKLDFVVNDSICKGDGLGGLIKEQNPRPAFRVKESRKIYLTITRHSDCTVNLYYRQIIGRPREYVVKQLERSNLKVGKLTYRPGGKAENTVVEASINGVPLFIEADPRAGEKPPKEPKKIPQNAVVDLVLLEGIDALPKYIPNLICDTYGAAEFAVKGSQFNMGTIHLQGNITDTLAAWVWKQSPPAGASATMGSGIDLWLMNEFPPGCEEEDPLPSDEDGSIEDGSIYEEEDGF